MCLKKCCFCVDLRIGSLICGYIMLVGNVGLLVFQIVSMYGIYAVTRTLDEGLKTALSLYMILLCVTASFVILELLFTIGLLVGLHKNKPRLVLVYIVSAATLQLLGLALKLWTAVQNYSKYSILEWTPIILYFLCLFIFVYFLSVFASYRKKMFGQQGEENSKAYYV